MGSESESESKSESESESKSESGSESGSESESESESESKFESKSESELLPSLNYYSDSEYEIESESDTQNTSKYFKLSEKYYRLSILKRDYETYESLGLLYMKNEQYNKALKIFELGIANNSGRCAVAIGNYYTDTLKFHSKALEYYTKALELLDNNSSIDDCANVYGELGYMYINMLSNIPLGIEYLKKGIELSNSYSCYIYARNLYVLEGDLDTEIVQNYKSEVEFYLLRSVEIDMNLDSIYQLGIFYKSKHNYVKMKKYLNLGHKMGHRYCTILLAQHYFQIGSNELAENYYSFMSYNYDCKYSLGMIAYIYCNQIYTHTDTHLSLCDNFKSKFIDLSCKILDVSDDKSGYEKYIWIPAFNLALYYYKICDLTNASKYLMIALDYYFLKYYDFETDFYGFESDLENVDNFTVIEYIDLYGDIFNFDKNKNIIKSIENISAEKNLFEYIEIIKKNILRKIANNYYPILIVSILFKINGFVKLLDLLKELSDTYSETGKKNFLLAMIKILEKKVNRKSIKNKIKLAKKKKIIKNCVVCYENKIHTKFSCGHEICIDCYKKVHRCYYKCI